MSSYWDVVKSLLQHKDNSLTLSAKSHQVIETRTGFLQVKSGQFSGCTQHCGTYVITYLQQTMQCSGPLFSCSALILQSIVLSVFLSPATLPCEFDICPSSLWAAAWCRDTAPGPPPRRCTPGDSTSLAQSWQGWTPASWPRPRLLTRHWKQNRDGLKEFSAI